MLIAIATAHCLDCAEPIVDWRRRFVPLRRGRPVLTAQGELALHVPALGACACGGATFEVRVTDSSRLAS